MLTVFWLIGDRVGIQVQAGVFPMVPPAARSTSYPPDHAGKLLETSRRKEAGIGGERGEGWGIRKGRHHSREAHSSHSVISVIGLPPSPHCLWVLGG